MKRSSAKIDLTQGSIFRLILLFALPICLGNVLQQLYSTVDTLVISNNCGTTSLAAVGTSATPVEILLCIFMGLGTGVSILVSQYVGAKESNKLQSVVRTSASLLYVMAIPLTVVGVVLGPVILRIMQVPEDAMGQVKYPTIVNLLMLWAVRIPVAVMIVTLFDGGYVMWAYPISFTVGMTAMLLYFLSPGWKRVLAKCNE